MSAVLQSNAHPIAEFSTFFKLAGHDIELNFEVYGSRIRGFPGSRETPAEPAWIDVTRLLANGHDITDWLNDDCFSKAFYDELYAR